MDPARPVCAAPIGSVDLVRSPAHHRSTSEERAMVNEQVLDERLAVLEAARPWSPRVIAKLEGHIRELTAARLNSVYLWDLTGTQHQLRYRGAAVAGGRQCRLLGIIERPP